MSAALESLMRVPPSLADSEANARGLGAFLLVGAAAALGFVATSSLAVMLLPHVESWVVSAVCYAAFIAPVYLLHRRFSFRSRVAHGLALPRYVAVQGMALALAALFSYLFHDVLGLPGLPAALLVIALTSGANYMVLKGWAFATSRHERVLPA